MTPDPDSESQEFSAFSTCSNISQHSCQSEGGSWGSERLYATQLSPTQQTSRSSRALDYSSHSINTPSHLAELSHYKSLTTVNVSINETSVQFLK